MNVARASFVVAAAAAGLAAGCGDPLVVLGDPPGLMRIVAGVPNTSGTHVDSLATQSLLSSPRGAAADADGVLYVADSRRIVAVASSGSITVLVDHTQGCAGACLGRPEGLALDGRGGLVIADPQGHRVWRLDLAARALTVLAGTGVADNTAEGAPDGTPGPQASLAGPQGVVVANDGTVYFTEFSGSRLRYLDPAGVLRTVAIDDASVRDLPVHAESEELFLNPAGLALAGGTLYVADSNHARVLTIELLGGRVRQLAGVGFAGFGGDGGPAADALLGQPTGLALSPDGRTLYLADTSNHRIRAVHLASATISTLAGTNSTMFAGDERPGSQTALMRPTAVAVSPQNFLFVADTGHHLVWRTLVRF